MIFFFVWYTLHLKEVIIAVLTAPRGLKVTFLNFNTKNYKLCLLGDLTLILKTNMTLSLLITIFNIHLIW